MTEISQKLNQAWPTPKKAWSEYHINDSDATSTFEKSPSEFEERGCRSCMQTQNIGGNYVDLGFGLVDVHVEDESDDDSCTRTRERSFSYYEDDDTSIARDIDAAVNAGDQGDKGYLPDLNTHDIGTPIKRRFNSNNSGCQGYAPSVDGYQNLSTKEILALKEGLQLKVRKVSSDFEEDFSSESEQEEPYAAAGVSCKPVENRELERQRSEQHIIALKLSGSFSSKSFKSFGSCSELLSSYRSQLIKGNGNLDRKITEIPNSNQNIKEHRRRKSAATRKIKILMLGDTGVGKSSLMNRFTENNFNPDLVGTVGVDFKTRNMDIKGERIVVQVWDTAGQERFHKITKAYYRGCHGILLVYDVGQPSTLDNISYWMDNLAQNASSGVKICLVGNKVDLREGNSIVSPFSCFSSSSPPRTDCEQFDSRYSDDNVMVFQTKTEAGRDIAAQYQVPFFETSAKSGHNVQHAYTHLISQILNNLDSQGENKPATQTQNCNHGLESGSIFDTISLSSKLKRSGGHLEKKENDKSLCRIS